MLFGTVVACSHSAFRSGVGGAVRKHFFHAAFFKVGEDAEFSALRRSDRRSESLECVASICRDSTDTPRLPFPLSHRLLHFDRRDGG